MFKRKPRSYAQMASDMVWPRGGWSRSAQYVVHRVRRLPDEPHRVARGFGIGVFVNFTPLFGFHLMLAMGMAWIMRANMLAAVLGTFVGNPLTTPLIAVLSVSLGRRMLGVHGSASPGAILKEFTSAGQELWQNFLAIFSDAPTQWDRLGTFFDSIFLPYLVGGLLPGIVLGIVAHYLTVPVIRAYHKRRAAKLRKRAVQLGLQVDRRDGGLPRT